MARRPRSSDAGRVEPSGSFTQGCPAAKSDILATRAEPPKASDRIFDSVRRFNSLCRIGFFRKPLGTFRADAVVPGVARSRDVDVLAPDILSVLEDVVGAGYASERSGLGIERQVTAASWNATAPRPWLFSVAPMMDWTDRHCRAFHRTLSRRARLYTEMVTTAAVLNGNKDRLLGFDAAEHTGRRAARRQRSARSRHRRPHLRRLGLRRDQPQRRVPVGSRAERRLRRMPDACPGSRRAIASRQ